MPSTDIVEVLDVVAIDDPRYHGAIGDGVTNDTTDLDACVAAAATALPVAPILLPAGKDFLVTAITNASGVPVLGSGRALKSIAGGLQQLNSYGDVGQKIFGAEYLACFHERLRQKLACTITMTGTSTTQGNANTVDVGYVPVDILARLAIAAGAIGQTFVNRGQSGQPITYWLSTSLAADLTSGRSSGPPDLLIWKWGENDITATVTKASVDAFIANVRTGLATARATATAATMAILMMSPAGMAQPSTGRDERWGEAINNGLRKAARDYQCCYYDTYCSFRDARSLLSVGWDSLGVHPKSVINAAMYSDIARLMYLPGLGLTQPANIINTLTLLNGWLIHDIDTRHVVVNGTGYITTPDSAAISIVGDIDLRVRIALNSWASGAIQILLSKLHATGTASYDFYVHPTGLLTYRWTPTGNFADIVTKDSTAATGLAAGTLKWVRATHDVNNGAAGNDVRFYTSPDGYGPVAGTGTVTVAGGAGAATFSVPQAPRVAITATTYVTTPDSAAISVVGDLDIRVRAALVNWNTGTIQELANKMRVSGQYAYEFYVSATGFLTYRWSANGTAIIAKVSTVVTGLAANAIKWVRVTHDVDNGAAGNDVKFWMSDDNVTYTQLGTTITTAGITSIFDGTDALHLGTSNGALPMGGNMFRTDVLNGIAGTVVATFNPLASAVDGDTSVIATTGETWTVVGGATVVAPLHSIVTIAGVDYPVASYDGTTAVLTGAPNGAGSAFIVSSWTQLGTTVTTAGVTSIFDGTDHLELGSSQLGTGLPMSGLYYRADIYNGIAGTLAATFNPAAVGIVSGATSVTATTGEVWTLVGGYSVYEELVRSIKNSAGAVFVQGNVKNGTMTAGTIIATLPVGSRPAASRWYPCATDTNGVTALIEVTSAGAVTIRYTPSSGRLALDNIQFMAP